MTTGDTSAAGERKRSENHQNKLRVVQRVVELGSRRFRDQIHGMIHLSEEEERIVDTPPFQRLRRIHQLAFTHFVYPGAEHTRFAHSLGVLDVATRVFDHLVVNTRPRPFDEAMEAHLRQVLRLYALLHDIGHAPFSHAGDDLFPPELDHEEYSRRLIMRDEIGTIVDEIGENLARQYGEDYRITRELIGDIIVGRDLNPRYHILRQIMNSEADADKMDYLLRDSVNCGVTYGQYDIHRLLNSFVAIQTNHEEYRLAIEDGGLHVFESFILARYWMFLQVYFHRTRRIYDFFYHNFLKEVVLRDTNGRFPEDLDEFLRLDDYRVWMELDAHKNSNPWAAGIVFRETWKCVFQSPAHAEDTDLMEFRFVENELQQRFDPNMWYIDHASKAPHELPKTPDSEDPQAIILVAREYEEIIQKDLYRESEIIRKIVAPISKYRVYAHPNIASDVKRVCNQVHNIARGQNRQV